MSIFILLVGLIIIELISIYVFEDLLSPACLACESFLLAFICACYSSFADNWNFDLHSTTVLFILIGLVFFLIGSFLAKGSKIKVCTQEKVHYIEPTRTKLIIILLIQIIILGIYIVFYRKSILQFRGMDWSSMLRAYRFTASYGDGLDVGIPGWVNQLTKLARVNAYISIYILMHNLAIHSIMKEIKLPECIILVLNVILYLPYSLFNAARFEFLVVIIMGIVIWYTYYQRCSLIIDKKRKNMKKTIWKIVVVVLLSMIGFSIFSSMFGRLQSNGIILEAANYFGRSIQAFDNYVQNPSFNFKINDKESLQAIVKLLTQLNIVDGEGKSFYLEFTNINGYSLGNVYTAFRRYYADYNLFGIMFFSCLGGFIFTQAYRRTKNPVVGDIKYGFLCYSSIVYCVFLYSYEELFFATVLSTNYLLIFIFLYFVSRWLMGDLKIFNRRIVIKRK